MKFFSKEWWAAAGERAIKTLAQTLAASLTAGAIVWGTAEWKEALLTAALAGLVSLLTSIASSKIGNYGPSLSTEGVVKQTTGPDKATVSFSGTPIRLEDWND